MNTEPIKLWAVDDGETAWVFARNRTEAIRNAAEMHGVSVEEVEEQLVSARPLADDETVTIRNDDEPEFITDPSAPEFDTPNPKHRERKTAAEWVAARGGSVLLGSTAF